MALRPTGIICIRLIRPRPMPKDLNAELSLNGLLHFTLIKILVLIRGR